MQRNPQSPQTQRPAARPQQPYPVSSQRSASRPMQPTTNTVRPGSRPNPVPAGAKPVNRSPHAQRLAERPQSARPASVRPASDRQADRRTSVKRTGTPFGGNFDHKSMILTAVGIALAIVVGCLMQYVVYPGGYFPDKNAKAIETVAEITSSRGVRINEVMSSNKTALSDENGDYPDWIELMNASNSVVDITGWSLLDKASRTTYFSFPDYQLDPGETVVVYASGRLSAEVGSDFNAPFRLGSAGDTLMLSDAHSTVVESINIPALGADQSYARQDGGWMITSEYTPGLENTTLNYAMLTSTQPISGSTLLISEVMADNSSFFSPDGLLYDWIEIHNAGTSTVDLKGYSLSDMPDRPARWKFPSVLLQPGQYLVVYASGLDQQTEDGVLHTNFGLRAEGESVLLYSESGQVLDYVEYDNLKPDQSLKRQSDGSYTTSGTATPGQAN